MSQRSTAFFVQGEKIVLKKDGTWVADGVEITHDQTRDLFNRSLHWDDEEKKYCLKIGYETMHIEVEDTPFFVAFLEHPNGSQEPPTARLTSFKSEQITAERLSFENGSLYLKLADGQRAKFLSAAYYDIMRGLQEDGGFYFLTIAGARVNLSPKDLSNPALLPDHPKRS